MEIKYIISYSLNMVTKEVKSNSVHKNNSNKMNNLFIRKEENNA